MFFNSLSIRFGAVLFAAGMVSCSSIVPYANDALPRVELVAKINLSAPVNAEYPFGGISGLDYDPGSDEFLAVSDDRSERGPGRFYRFKLDSDLRITNLRTTVLRDSQGEIFAPGQVDAESIRYYPNDRIIWSSERGPKGPAIYVTDLNHKTTSRFELPNHVSPDPGRQKGARPNKFIEGITFTPDFRFVIFALEAPLSQDDEPPDIDRGAYTRLLVYRVDTAQLTAEYLYPLDPIPKAAEVEPKLHDNGVSEILAIDKERLLVLERSGRHIGNMDFDFDNRVYLAQTAEAVNIAGVDSAGVMINAGPKAVKKRLLLSVGDFTGHNQENFEGMSFGPLIDGKSSLYLISDDNFHRNQQTQLLLFTLGK